MEGVRLLKNLYSEIFKYLGNNLPPTLQDTLLFGGSLNLTLVCLSHHGLNNR